MREFPSNWDEPIHGALAVNKPAGPTSHDIVESVRRFYNTRAGHTGTLDPLASGVLVLLLGKATRLARFLQGNDKTYQATIQLGLTTDTYDREGKARTWNSIPYYSRQQLDNVLEGFQGKIEQIPPMFSAVRLGGERLYKKARRGEKIERTARQITIHCLKLKKFAGSSLTVDIVCSAGTYIRVLAHEIGKTLGCGACLWDLCRIRSGDFWLGDTVMIQKLSRPPLRGFKTLDCLLPSFQRIDLKELTAGKIRNGNPIAMSGPPGYCRLFYENSLLAIAHQTGEMAKPVVVFPHESD